MTSPLNLPSSLFETIPWSLEPSSIWVTSSLILRRNLARYNFPGKLSSSEFKQVLELLKGTLMDAIPKALFFSEKELSSSDREVLFEHFFMMHGFKQPQNGAALLLDAASAILATVNMGNHLELRTFCPGGDFGEIWQKLAEIEDRGEKAHDFAFNPKFGYLTADPAECGTAVTARAYLHTPALVHTNQIDSALKNAEDHEVNFSGLTTQDLSELVGDLIIIENRYTIGMSEEAIFHAVQGAATKLLSAEKMMRDHLKEKLTPHVKDQISKAFGLILHSHQLETKEALDLLSLMKLGVALGLITGVDDRALSFLFFKSRKGHLSRLFPDVTEAVAIEEKRADFLQTELKDVAFKD